MKLSFTTLGCPDWSFDKILKEAQKLGFPGLEVRGIDGVMKAEEIPLFFDENIEETKKYLKNHEIELIGFGTSVKFHDDENYDSAIEEGKAAIDVCQKMGMRFVRVFGDKVPSPEVKEHVIEQAIKGLGTLCEYAAGKNVEVLLEIHGDFNTLDVVMPLIENLKQYPEFGILWDIEHSDKTYKDNWMEFYSAIKPAVKHVHVKDYIRKEGTDFELCLVGEGDIPIKDILAQLKKDGYDGYYSLEWEKKWHPELPEPEIAVPGYMEFMKNIEL